MRHFVKMTLEHMKGQSGSDSQSLFEREKLSTLCIHSDNCSQHFKSAKTMHWLTKQIEDMGFTSVLWDFGPPGHGKVKNYFWNDDEMMMK
jgi:hypothetical protein